MPRFVRTAFAIAALALLTACVEQPAQRCAPNETRELATVNQLIVETRENIERGYVLVREDSDIGLNLCLGGRRSNVGLGFCSNPASRTHPEAIDKEIEIRKLDALLARRDALTARISALTAACPAR